MERALTEGTNETAVSKIHPATIKFLDQLAVLITDEVVEELATNEHKVSDE